MVHLVLVASMMMEAGCLEVVGVELTTKMGVVHHHQQKIQHCSEMSLYLTARGEEQVLLRTSNERGVPQEPACACVLAAACPQVAVCWWKSPLGAVRLVYYN